MNYPTRGKRTQEEAEEGMVSAHQRDNSARRYDAHSVDSCSQAEKFRFFDKWTIGFTSLC